MRREREGNENIKWREEERETNKGIRGNTQNPNLRKTILLVQSVSSFVLPRSSSNDRPAVTHMPTTAHPPLTGTYRLS
jgi:hypothetical protein